MEESSLTPAQKIQLREEKLAAAYREMFGDDPSKRTSIQELVWADLEARCYYNRPTMIPNTAGDVDRLRTDSAEGARCVFLYIRGNVFFRPEIQH